MTRREPGRHSADRRRRRWRTLPAFFVRLNRFQVGVLVGALALCAAGVFLAVGMYAAVRSTSAAECTNATIVQVRRGASRIAPGLVEIEYSRDGTPVRAKAWGDYAGDQAWAPGDPLTICFVARPQGFATADGLVVSTSLLPYYLWTLPVVLGTLTLAAFVSTVVITWRDDEDDRALE